MFASRSLAIVLIHYQGPGFIPSLEAFGDIGNCISLGLTMTGAVVERDVHFATFIIGSLEASWASVRSSSGMVSTVIRRFSLMLVRCPLRLFSDRRMLLSP